MDMRWSEKPCIVKGSSVFLQIQVALNLVEIISTVYPVLLLVAATCL